MNHRVGTLAFPAGQRARAAWVRHPSQVRAALRELGLDATRPTLVVLGGAAGLRENHRESLDGLFAEQVVPLLDELGAAAVDGGTDAGVMRLMGKARASAGARFPLVGVVPTGMVRVPGDPATERAETDIEPNHSHFVLVPGNEWGDESPWLEEIARLVAGDRPSVTLLVNGGDIAFEEVARSVGGGRAVLAVVGSGRLADDVAGALRGETTTSRVAELARSGLLEAVDPWTGPRVLGDSIRRALSQKDQTGER